MKSNTENVILDSFAKVELLVSYNYEEVIQYEECHGVHDTSYIDIDITYVELVIAGKGIGINLIQHLDSKQIQELQSNLQIEN